MHNSSESNKIHDIINSNYSDRVLYSTDSSVYKQIPSSVACPQNINELKSLINYAKKNNLAIIPRSAGTSLAGQCVGSGIVTDLSTSFNNIIELNIIEKWVRIEPSIILNNLNKYLEDFSLFFGPETSTSNRCMIGGMIGNNSCGLHSLKYGSVREHIIEVKVLLCDGSEVVFKQINKDEFSEKLNLNCLEGDIYRFFYKIFNDEYFCNEINNNYPAKSIPRRNTGYCFDILLDDFKNNKLNLAKLFAGAEGTLGIVTEVKLNLVELPPKNKILVCVHLNSIDEACLANLIALKLEPYSVELMDNKILNLALSNKEQEQNSFFIKNNPGAIVIVEFASNNIDELSEKANQLEFNLKQNNLGYHFPIIKGKDINKVWNLRTAGLGVLSLLKGDAKPVAVIEDTAIPVENLGSYLNDIKSLLKKNELECVFFAHIGTGELHLRPIINLKTKEGQVKFKNIANDVCELVKTYKGSLSGEHGDGRLRGEFIEKFYGKTIYNAFVELKSVFDKNNIFNIHKIINTPPMDESFRVELINKNIETIFDFSDSDGIIRAVERCNGSADCRKTILAGGTMCPSYMATLNEKYSTRARANLLREFFYDNNISDKDVFEIINSCLSCKGCKSECPSNVDMALLKAEFLHQYYKNNSASIRTKAFANINRLYKAIYPFRSIYNYLISNKFIAKQIKILMGIAPERLMPKISKKALFKYKSYNKLNYNKEICLFIDEFTNYLDSEIGVKVIDILNLLGYKVNIVNNCESGRAYISKGLIKKAKKIANKNIEIYSKIINKNMPLIGIEPSAILTFRDEYLKLVDDDKKAIAKNISENTYTFEEFLFKELENGNIDASKIKFNCDNILIHSHCHQKSLGKGNYLEDIINKISKGENIKILPTGCCGMAGSFGYEKENYKLSIEIGELVLFPSIRKMSKNSIVVASGTSCRQQIYDGTKVKALHLAEVLEVVS